MPSEEKKNSRLSTYERIYSNTIHSDNFDEMNNEVLKILEKYQLIHRKNIYYLFIESVQNVIRHGLKNDHKQSVFHLLKNTMEEKYLLITGNPLEKNEEKTLTHRIDMINKLNKKSIDVLFFNRLDNDHFTKKGGAGLGLLHMKKSSNYNTISYHIKEYEGFRYFYLILEYHIN